MNEAIPARGDVPAQDKWDLSALYKTQADWNRDLRLFCEKADKLLAYKNRLSESGAVLADCLDEYSSALLLADKLGNYAFLLKSGDEGCDEYRRVFGEYMMAATEFETKVSFLRSEIQKIDEASLSQWLADERFNDYRVWISKLLYLKPHILSENEERLLALHSEAVDTPNSAFGVLTDVDMKFEAVPTKEGDKPLSQTTFTSFLENPDRTVRREAYFRFYKEFDDHKNTLAALYAGSVHADVAAARARNYSSARQRALFPDKAPESVYDNLISVVNDSFGPLHKYYELRKKALKLDDLRHYDVYVPFAGKADSDIPFEDAVELLRGALSPLGEEYVGVLTKGLLGGWVDKYENKGKRSGAFSSGGYEGYPYISLNYKKNVLRDVFTLAHEGGHSMHSWYSSKNNPFMHYNYTIFEAEVASTFNEELLFRYLLDRAKDADMRAWLLCNRASDILATLYRQTMFAEYEMQTHSLVENGVPLTAKLLRDTYRALLEKYFGPTLTFESTSDLECLRIPHFYRAFYVYKYATGISASLALADRVLSGGEREREDYFQFLKSGGSRYPLDSLRLAGVDMTDCRPVYAAVKRFESIINELETMIT